MMWLGVAALLFIGAYIYGLNVFARWRLRHIPGPKPWWLFGNLREMGSSGMHVALIDNAKRYGPIYKMFFGRFPVIVITDPDLVKQVCVKQFMTFHDRQYNLVNLHGNHDEPNCTMTEGMLSARGKYWAGLRASCEPVFHSSQLQRYAPLMYNAAVKLSARLLKAAQSASQDAAAVTSPAIKHADARQDTANLTQDAAAKPVANGNDASPKQQPSLELSTALGSLTMEVIGTSAFGVTFDTERPDSRIVHAANFITKPAKKSRGSTFNRLGNLLVPELGQLFFLLSSWTGVESVRNSFAARGYLLGTTQILLRNARARLAATENGGTADAEPVAKLLPPATSRQGFLGRLMRNKDLDVYNQAKADSQRDYGGVNASDTSLIHHLMRASNKETGEPFTEQQIMAQSNTFLLAGYETTSTALMFAILCLMENPAANEKLLSEVDAFDWSSSKGLGLEDLTSFPYTRAVIDEAMRLYPPVAPLVGLQREASADAMLGSYHIRRGQKIWINVFGIHHDPSLWPDPEAFKPERFLEGNEEAANRHPCAYLPFGVGPRKCIGYKFALEEAVITLATLVHRFSFALDKERHPDGAKGLNLSCDVTLNVKGGLWVHVTPRQLQA